MSAMVKRSSANHLRPAMWPSSILSSARKIGTLRGEIGGPLGGRLFCVLEHRNIRRIRRAEQPIHPTFDHGAFGGCRSRQRWSMHRGEIAKDRVGFPDHQIAVDEGWYFRVRIELAVLVSEGIAELTPVILADIRNASSLALTDSGDLWTISETSHPLPREFGKSLRSYPASRPRSFRRSYSRRDPWRPAPTQR